MNCIGVPGTWAIAAAVSPVSAKPATAAGRQIFSAQRKRCLKTAKIMK